MASGKSVLNTSASKNCTVNQWYKFLSFTYLKNDLNIYLFIEIVAINETLRLFRAKILIPFCTTILETFSYYFYSKINEISFNVTESCKTNTIACKVMMSAFEDIVKKDITLFGKDSCSLILQIN